MRGAEFLERANAFDHVELTFREDVQPGVEFRAHAVANPVHPSGGPYDEAAAIWYVGGTKGGAPVYVSTLDLPALRRIVQLAESCEAWGQGGSEFPKSTR